MMGSRRAPFSRGTAAVAAALLGTLPGCALGRTTTNSPLDPTLLERLEPGVTTAREVTEWFGGPSQVVQLGERSAYRFDHEVTKAAALILLLVNLGATDTRSDRLWVFFDENGVLTHYGASLEAHRTQYALPWEDVHEEHEDRAADEDRGLVPDDDR